MNRRTGIFLLSTLVFAVPVSVARGDVILLPGPTLVAEHAGITIDDSFFGGPAAIDGAQLSGVDDVWNVGFPVQWSEMPIPPERAVIGVFEGAFWSPSYPLIQGKNFSFAHTAINPDTATTTVSIPAPLLGSPDMPSGTYTLFVYELPATKYVCQNVEPYACVEEPYTDQDFIDYLTTDTTQPDAPPTYPPLGARFIVFNYVAGEAPHSCATGCFSNVLFLPGIEASRLYRPDYAGGTNQLWEPNTDGDVRDLYMNPDGTSARTDIYTKDVMDEAYGALNIYKSFLADLNAWKNTDQLIADYTAAPYDWRLSLDDLLNYGNQFPDGRIYYSGDLAATSSPYIIQELRRLAESSKTGKVTIVAHSNGGLVAKALLKRLQDTNDPLLDAIDTVIMVAVPQIGTPKAIGAILHGYKQAIPFDSVHPFLSPQVAREFAYNDPMAHHLLPSAAYFNGDGGAVRTPLATFNDGLATQIFINAYGNAIGNGAELHDFLLGLEGRAFPLSSDLANPTVLRPELLSYGEGTHQVLDGWMPPQNIAVHEIAGWGIDTVAGITYDTDRKCVSFSGRTCVQFATALRYTPDLVADGDGTVVAPSALAMSTSSPNVQRWWVNLGDYNDPIVGTNRDHKDILEISELRAFIKGNLLTKSTTTLPLFLTKSTPVPTTNVKRLRFFLHSPLALSATDAVGQEISASTSTILGARYERFGDVQYISLPASAHPTLHLEGFAAGSFTLEVQEIAGDTVGATTTFLGIPNATTTTAQMDFGDGTIEHASPLAVDTDGNGTTDITLQPKVGAIVLPDTTPPEIKMTFSTSTKALSFIGTDDMGATTITATTTYPILKKKQKEHSGVATTTITARDEAGNTTVLVYTEKLPSPKQRDTIMLHALAYNGATTTLTNSSISYKWRTNKNGSYKLFVSHIKTTAIRVESHYRPKKDQTVIMTKPRDLDDNDSDDDVDGRPVKQKFSGMIIPSLVTWNGGLNISY